MAEATFAVTQTAPGIRAPVCYIDRQAMADSRVIGLSADNSAAVACVSSGRLVKGCEIRIVSEGGDELPAGRIGHLLVRSTALFDGYRNHPQKTREAMADGWYRTGDIGFRVGDEYFVVGRSKDVIIVAGKNIYPEDIETVVNEVDGVLRGRAVAFGVENVTSGTEEIWIVAETGLTDDQAIKALRRGILKASLHADVTVSRVVLVPPRWLFKTSSGKPCRPTNRERAMVEVTQRVSA
jgi:acyl-CoA synthetase (AMP-forming)/AMP-acid ligase II